jgi:hypothetical protein
MLIAKLSSSAMGELNRFALECFVQLRSCCRLELLPHLYVVRVETRNLPGNVTSRFHP